MIMIDSARALHDHNQHQTRVVTTEEKALLRWQRVISSWDNQDLCWRSLCKT